MAEMEERGKPDDVVADANEKNCETPKLIEIDSTSSMGNRNQQEETLYVVLHRLLAAIFTPNSNISPLEKIKISIVDNEDSLREASRNSVRQLLLWTRQGSPFRALIVISVGTIVLLALTGLLFFMLFFLAATISAVFISLIVSLVTIGGFLALFFVCVAAIYIGALLIAVFVISATTISTITVALIATGWIGFFWTCWLMTKKSVGLVEHLIHPAYSTAWRVHPRDLNKFAE